MEVYPGLTFLTARNLDEPEKADSNGGGKTTWLNAISLALYGETPSGLTMRDLRCHYAGPQDSVSIELYFDDFLVERTLAKKEHLKVFFVPNTWEPDGEEWVGDLKVVQKKLEDYLGLSFQMFQTTAYLCRGSGSIAFLTAKPAQRAKLLSELIDDHVFQLAGELVKQELKRNEKELTALEHRVAHRKTSLVTLVEDIKRQKMSVAEALAASNKRREDIRARLSNAREQLQTAQITLLKQARRTMREVEDDRARLVQQLESVRLEARKYWGVSVPNLEVGTKCPTCRVKVTSAHLQECVEEVEKLRKMGELAEKQVSNLNHLIRNLEVEQQELRDLANEHARAKKDFDYYNTEVALLQDELNAPDVSMESLREAYQKTVERYKTTKLEIEADDSAIAKLSSEARILSWLKIGFTQEIRNILFDKIREQLRHYTKAYVYALCGDAITVEYPTSEGGARDKFEILVHNAGNTQELSAYSEGENWRILFALVLSLRRVRLNNCNSKLNFMLIDDPIGGLDETGIRQFLQTIRELGESGEVNHLLVTIPRDSVLEGDRVITIEKKGRVSRIL